MSSPVSGLWGRIERCDGYGSQERSNYITYIIVNWSCVKKKKTWEGIQQGSWLEFPGSVQYVSFSLLWLLDLFHSNCFSIRGLTSLWYQRWLHWTIHLYKTIKGKLHSYLSCIFNWNIAFSSLNFNETASKSFSGTVQYRRNEDALRWL